MSDTMCMYKLPDTGLLCGATATMKTSVNEDPWGFGVWCDGHAPAAAVSINPPDPNRDNRPINRGDVQSAQNGYKL